MKERKKITVVGAGYVGMSIASTLARTHEILILESDKEKIGKINSDRPSIDDSDIKEFYKKHSLSIQALENKDEAYKEADFIIICVPTNFDKESSSFDTSIVEQVTADALKHNNNALIIIKSTVPVGYTKLLQKKHKTKNIIFSPEFLREHFAMYDVLNPSRIIVGNESESSLDFAEIISESTEDKSETLLMKSSDAEAVKLFSNTYLAMRVAFFNELDTFSISKELSTENVIKGVSTDPRIGKQYNNPSFGYGGYCLPKDTKQLLKNFEELPQTIIQSVISSNEARKKFIIEEIKKIHPKVVGIYRLTSNAKAQNFRHSEILDIIDGLSNFVEDLIIYEPLILEDDYMGFRVIKDIDRFKIEADLIVSNRKSDQINDVSDKLYSRDLFRQD
ncbi:nucleotide sugar dehydrogenase [Gammaproteobacteria bacterium]|nr:nucleotide sugar dehydrogenase [Gammaproteobacteria bacterium]